MSNFLGVPKRDAYRTELSVSIDAADLEAVLVLAPGFTLDVGQYMYGVFEPGTENREGVKITAIDGNIITIERGLPVYEGDVGEAKDHNGGVEFIISDNWQLFKDMTTAINSKLDNDGGNAGDSFDLQIGDFRIRKDGDDMKLTDTNNLEVTLSTLTAGAGVDTKAAVSNNDTTPGFLNGKLVAGLNITLTENNDGGDETLIIAASSANELTTGYTIYTPAYMYGGSSAESNYLLWKGTDDGWFKQTIDGVTYNIGPADFTGVEVVDMDSIAAILQTAIRAATGGEETVVWDVGNTRLQIDSVNTTSDSEVSALSQADGNPGTDISDVFMDGRAASATVVDAVIDEAAHAGLSVALDETGKISTDFYNAIQAEAIPDEGDLVVGDGAGGVIAIPVGRDGFNLQADSNEDGGLVYAPASGVLSVDGTDITISNAGVLSAEIYNETIPAGILNGGMVIVEIGMNSIDLDDGDSIEFHVDYGGSSLTFTISNNDATGDNIIGQGTFTIKLIGTGAASQLVVVSGSIGTLGDGPTSFYSNDNSTAVDSTVAETLSIEAEITASAGNTAKINSVVSYYIPPLNIS